MLGVFGGHPHKLLCAWHVDRAWREHIKQIGQNVLQVQVYHNLNVQLPFIMMTLQRPNLHRRGGYKRGVPMADVVSIFQHGAEIQTWQRMPSAKRRTYHTFQSLFTANTCPKHMVQLFTLTRSYFIAFELHFFGDHGIRWCSS